MSDHGCEPPPPGLIEAYDLGQSYAKDRAKAKCLLDEALRKTREKYPALMKVTGELAVLLRLTLAWVNGSYVQIPRHRIAWVLGALIYLVNPFDLVPDFLPGVGYLDDIAVIVFIYQAMRQEREDFLTWENSR